MGPGIDNLISVTSVNKNGKTKTSYAVSDALGSIRAILGENGQELNRYEYTPFGVAFKAVEGVKQPYRFTGRRWDPNTNLYWYRSMSYDPGRGRFTQADKWSKSKVNGISYHLFKYVSNNPTMFSDPIGWERIVFQLGSMRPNDAKTLIGDFSPDKIIEASSESDVFNYILNGGKGGRSKDKITEMLFLGHGNQLFASGKNLSGSEVVLTAGHPSAEWDRFFYQNKSNFDNIFSANLNVEFRVCMTGYGNYLESVAESLPSGTRVTGYTTDLTTTYASQLMNAINPSNLAWGGVFAYSLEKLVDEGGPTPIVKVMVDPEGYKKTVLNVCGSAIVDKSPALYGRQY